MSLLDYSKEIASVAVAVLGVIGKWVTKSRASMVYASRYNLTHLLPPFRNEAGDITVASPVLKAHGFIVRNNGKEPLSDVIIVLNWEPQSLNVWPARPYEPVQGDHNRYSLTFTTLSPGEELFIETIAVHAPMPEILLVRSREALAREIQLVPMPAISKWRVRCVQLLCFAGVAAFVYISLWLLRGLLTDNWTWGT